MDINTTVGKHIELARRERNWNQDALASEVGVEQNTISRWERGQVSVTADNLWRLCEIFSKPVTYFFAPLPEMKPKKARRRREPEK